MKLLTALVLTADLEGLLGQNEPELWLVFQLFISFLFQFDFIALFSFIAFQIKCIIRETLV